MGPPGRQPCSSIFDRLGTHLGFDAAGLGWAGLGCHGCREPLYPCLIQGRVCIHPHGGGHLQGHGAQVRVRRPVPISPGTLKLLSSDPVFLSVK